uniref:Uncharacterized protein n=1 Tax=Anguilla anguilla TaxID=7936 RepID=A0A0E9QVT9_ANGAN
MQLAHSELIYHPIFLLFNISHCSVSIFLKRTVTLISY